MTREAIHAEEFTPFGLWVKEKLRDSRRAKNGRAAGLCVTNLDYVFESFKPIAATHARRCIMLVEEKQNGASLQTGQQLTFHLLDKALRIAMPQLNYDYWGFYLLSFSGLGTSPSDDAAMSLNGNRITEQELIDHLDFYKRFCEPMVFSE